VTTKQDLHEALQAQARAMPGVPPAAYLTRWVVIRELALPSGSLVMNYVTGQASGEALTIWDARGLCGQFLDDLPALQSPSSPEPPPADGPREPPPF
jgi:hypothetical protein